VKPVLTSFYIRFTAEISPTEFEELLKVAKRVEKVHYTYGYAESETFIVIGKHWIVIAEKKTDKYTTRSYITLPCSGTEESCVEPVEENESKWLYEYADTRCEDIILSDVRYSNRTNEADLMFTCFETTYRAMFNVAIDPSAVEQHDSIILQIIARYFGVRDLPAMFRPM
jgi:hypothetical protein